MDVSKIQWCSHDTTTNHENTVYSQCAAGILHLLITTIIAACVGTMMDTTNSIEVTSYLVRQAPPTLSRAVDGTNSPWTIPNLIMLFSLITSAFHCTMAFNISISLHHGIPQESNPP